MSVDVADVLGRELRIGQGVLHAVQRPGARGIGDVTGIGTETIATDLGEDLRPSFLRLVETFENENRRAFAHHESIAFSTGTTERNIE